MARTVRLQPLEELQYLNSLPRAGLAQPSLVWCPLEKWPGLKGQAIPDTDSWVTEIPPRGERAGALRQGSVCVPAFLGPQVGCEEGVFFPESHTHRHHGKP